VSYHKVSIIKATSLINLATLVSNTNIFVAFLNRFISKDFSGYLPDWASRLFCLHLQYFNYPKNATFKTFCYL